MFCRIHRMTLQALSEPANLLSTSRFLLAPVLGVLIYRESWTWAAAVVAWAVASDLLDGPIARRRCSASSLGTMLDHSADAATVIAGCAALGALAILPEWLFALIGLAFLQYAGQARIWKGGRLRASMLGRCNGVAYFVVVCVPVFQSAFGIEWVSPSLLYVFGWVLVVSTLVSMGARMLFSQQGTKQP